MFPYFDTMLQLSNQMILIISEYQKTSINNVMIGKELNKLVSYYKIYLEYFKNKTEMKRIYEDLEKNYTKKLKDIEGELQGYFQRYYEDKIVKEGKDKS